VAINNLLYWFQYF